MWPKGQPAYRDVPSKVYPGKPRVMVLRNVRENPWDWLMNLINRLANQHEPILDFDSDLFSGIPSQLLSTNSLSKTLLPFVALIGEERTVKIGTTIFIQASNTKVMKMCAVAILSQFNTVLANTRLELQWNNGS